MFDKLPPKIFLVERFKNERPTFLNSLERSGFNVFRIPIISLKKELENNKPELVILDCNSLFEGRIDNKHQELKTQINAPLMFLLDKKDFSSCSIMENDNRSAFLVKPFSDDQLIISIKTLLRRSKMVLQDKIIKYKDISMDLNTYKVYENEQVVHLGPTEFKILQLFVQSPKTIFSRQMLIELVWKDNKIFDHRTIDVHINRIRNALKVTEDKKHYIKTIRSQGYCLDLPNSQNKLEI